MKLSRSLLDTRPHQDQGGNFLAGGRQLLPHYDKLALEEEALLLQQLFARKESEAVFDDLI